MLSEKNICHFDILRRGDSFDERTDVAIGNWLSFRGVGGVFAKKSCCLFVSTHTKITFM